MLQMRTDTRTKVGHIFRGKFWLTCYAVVAIIHVSDDILDMGTTVGHSFGADSGSHAIVKNSTPCT